MKIVVVHNFYRQRGGEDEAFATETALLAAHGHHVSCHTVHNDSITTIGRLRLARDTVWSRESYAHLRGIVRRERPDIVHFHNTFPLISPAAYVACRDEGVPVIQTLHNYRLVCPNALLFRDGHVCESCVGKRIPWRAVVHRCYRDSAAASAVTAVMLAVHNTIGTYIDSVDLFVAYSQFARRKYIEAGFPEGKVVYKSNCLHPAPAVGAGEGSHALFVGRLTPEKGVRTLLDAWEMLDGRVPLQIVGDGPLRDEVACRAATMEHVEYVGRRPLEEVFERMGAAVVLIVPSEWYETFGRVVIEAYAKGTPVIASNIGGVGELIRHGQTGLHFAPGDAADLAAQVRWLSDRPAERASMRRQARTEFEEHFAAEVNYRRLISIYEQALGR